jgi:hypothetical protein
MASEYRPRSRPVLRAPRRRPRERRLVELPGRRRRGSSPHPEGGPVRRDALLFAAFDQRVDPAAVLASVGVRAAGAAARARLARPRRSPARTGRASRPERRARPLAGVPDRGAAASGRGCRGERRPGHAVGRGNPEERVCRALELPHLRPVPRAQERVRLERALRAARRVAGRAHEPHRREDAGERGRARRAHAGGAQGGELGYYPRDPRRRQGAHLLPGIAFERAPRRFRPSTRARRAAHVVVARAPLPGGDFGDRSGGRAARVTDESPAPRPGVRGAPTTERLSRIASEFGERKRRPPPAAGPDTTVRVSKPDELTETRIDLRLAPRRPGPPVVAIRPTLPGQGRFRQPGAGWVRRAHGLDAFADGETLLACQRSRERPALAGRACARRRQSNRRPASHGSRSRTPPAPVPSRAVAPTSRSSRSSPRGGASAGGAPPAARDALRRCSDDRRLQAGLARCASGWLRRTVRAGGRHRAAA